MEIKDLAGLGHAAEKFLSLIESSIGSLYRPKSIRAEGKAQADVEAYKLLVVARAQSEAKIIEADAEQQLEERALRRMRQQELSKQLNIESIVDQAIDEVGAKDVNEDSDPDWLSFFFESCATISDKKVQGLWARLLAEKVTSGETVPRKLIDCLRWIDSDVARDFIKIAPTIFLFSTFPSTRATFKKKVWAGFRLKDNLRFLEEVGLLKLASSNFIIFSNLYIGYRRLSAGSSFEFNQHYEFTASGRSLAKIACPRIAQYHADRCLARDEYLMVPPEAQDRLDSLVLSPGRRKLLLIGNIVNALAFEEIEISIDAIIREDDNNISVRILRIVKKDKKFMGRIDCHRNANNFKKLSAFQQEFIASLMVYLKKNFTVRITKEAGRGGSKGAGRRRTKSKLQPK
jgi:hypothetical protein